MIKTEDAINYFKQLSWLDEIMVGHKGFIAGGCFKNIFNSEKVKDIDIFFNSADDFAVAVRCFDICTSGYNGEDREEAKYNFYYENDKVKAYKRIKDGVVIELCRSVYGTPEQVLNRFDFTICKFAYYKEESTETEDDGKLVTKITYKVAYQDRFFEHLHLKRLVIDDIIPFPMSTFERMIRYVKYGYMPCRETKLKLIDEIRELSDDQVLLAENLYNGWD